MTTKNLVGHSTGWAIASIIFLLLCIELFSGNISIITNWALDQDTQLVSGLAAFLIILIFFVIFKKIKTKRESSNSDKSYYLDLQADRDKANKMKRRYRNFAEAEIHGNEAERLRIARELHDDTIHRLIILGQQIELLKYDNPDNPLIKELDELIKLADQGIDHIRGVIKELRPSYLAKRGLIPAIRGLVKEKSGRTINNIEFIVEGDEYRLNDEVELILYRLTQTALQNVRLHSQSTDAVIILSFQHDHVKLVIEDNGIGFEVPNEADLFDSGHFGLLGMKERTQLCNGTFMIHSISGSGTCISAEIPRGGNVPQNTPQ